MPVRIVIIGGGASGLAAAITAARQDADVTILEHKDRVGKKILMTGNGKCNLTNLSDYHGKYYGENIKSIYGVLSRFTPMDTIEFFKEIGLYTKQKKDGGIYPVSEQASAVLDVLRTTCDHLGVKTLTECEPSKIITGKNGGTVQYIYQKKEKRQIPYDKLILATGGQAAPVSGSDGTGLFNTGRLPVNPNEEKIQVYYDASTYNATPPGPYRSLFITYDFALV